MPVTPIYAKTSMELKDLIDSIKLRDLELIVIYE